jgi:amino acid adenylation domain-containing protein
MKSGGAYVPMDINYPKERIDYILEDTGAELILSQKKVIENHSILPLNKVLTIDLDTAIYRKEAHTNLREYSAAKDLAYVIYTSGTTGKPKGVMIEHKSLVNSIVELYPVYDVSTIKKVSAFTSYVFDVSVSEIFTSITQGIELHLFSDATRTSIDEISKYLVNNKINLAYLPPVLLSELPQEDESSLISILYAGEPCDKQTAIRWSKKVKLFNYYGPTESTIYATGTQIKYDEVKQIGKPIANSQAYLLDGNNTPVPIGVVGELFIGGAGVARGYLNREELTAEKFIPNPFASAKDKESGYTRLYKTGDLAKWLPDGNIEFIGRNDDQVKIRGFRIELGEIESTLTTIGGIKQCCVLAKERSTDSGTTKYITAYYVGETLGALSEDTLIEQLSELLPEYMIPSIFIEMESFALTVNGKLDRKALPEPDFIASEDAYTAPTTAIEEQICEIWAKAIGIEKVGTTADFFRIGGNSILAIQASHKMSNFLECEITVASIFNYKTISQILKNGAGIDQVKIPKLDTNEALLSFAQERLWFIEQYEKGTNAYHIPAVFELDTQTDVNGIKFALREVVKRHEVLRSTIELDSNQELSVQKVHHKELEIEEILFDANDAYKAKIKEEINTPFDLSKEYPIRAKIYRIEDKTILLVNTHHIASDGWSLEIFQEELYAYYSAYNLNDKNFSLPALEIQYKDFASWERTYLTEEKLKNQLDYWKEKLTGYQNLELSTDFVRPTKVDYKGSLHDFSMDKSLSNKLRKTAQKHGTTLHNVILSAAHVLLHKYTAQNDIIIGSPIANRHRSETKDLIGFFVNTQANRAILSDSQTFEDLILQNHRDQIEAQEFQDLPFEKLVDELGVTRDSSRHPVYQVSFAVQSFGNEKGEDQKEYLKPLVWENIYEIEKFDFSIFIDDSNEELRGQISYATSLFEQSTITRLSNHFNHLLGELVEEPLLAYSKIGLLNDQEYDIIVNKWNETEKDFPRDKTVQQAFEAQVLKTPDNIALVFEGDELSYQELNERSNQLARHIRDQYKSKTTKELAANTLIALYLDRGLEMVVGILAVMKSGGAYVPMDINYPKDRIDYLLEDTGAELILSQKSVIESSSILPLDKVLTIDLENAIYKNEEHTNLRGYSSAKDLAYVIYTSGTTGKPKGVMIEHKAVLSLIHNDYITVEDNDVFAFFSSPVFDAATFELWTPLVNGNALIIPTDVKELASSSNEFKTFISENKISILWFTKTLFESIYTLDNTIFETLNYLIVGGEALDKNIINRITSSLTKPKNFLNGYGPTESTTFTTTYVLNKFIEQINVPIGKPINNRTVYVLDENNHPVPIGGVGELFIGGAGIASGYLNREELTTEKFISNPFASEKDKESGYTRLYKSGDLVKWLPSGDLEYIGRNDDQVKIRGFRIELGEIESVLTNIPGIKQCSVLAKERSTDSGSTKYIAAYYVGETLGALSDDVIIEHLTELLPEYMIPSIFIELESFPLTVNGKLDKKSLPAPDFIASEDEYRAPTTEIEEQICEIWAKAIGIEKVGVTDDFFRIGGNSILAIQASVRMSKVLGIDINVADVFKCKTIQSLAIHLETELSKEQIEGEEWEI